MSEYDIKLNSDATRFALSTPRWIPLPMMDQVKAGMENQQITSKVEGSTDWCSGIVVVQKTNKKIRIYIDLTHLNTCVRTERHVLPSVDHTLAQLSKTKLFSKLDANSGFW